MKKHFTPKKISLGIITLLIIFQFFRIDKSTKALIPEKDFILLSKANPEVTALLKNSCYDCHSNQINYPWYTNIAPVSWWVKNHINEGSHHLNFSDWGNYSSRKADHKLKECIEMIKGGEMPLESYTWMHGSAKLSKEQQSALVAFFTFLRTYESEKPKPSQS